MSKPWVFLSTKVKSLKSILTINNEVDLISSTTNPTSSAVNAPAGSLLLNTSSGILYRKTDAGSSTNWSQSNPFEIVSKTANYTATAIDDVISVDGSAGGFTISFPTAASTNTGKVYTIYRTDDTKNGSGQYANKITIAAVANMFLYVGNESCQVISDGSSWRIIQQPCVHGNYTPVLSSSTNVSANTQRNSVFSKVGNTITASGTMALTPTSGSAGTPVNTDFYITLPITTTSTDSTFGGGCVNANPNNIFAGDMYLDGTTDKIYANLLSKTTSATQVTFTFTYKIQ